MRKTMSLKQHDANRRNAKKSTGPKTENGKAVSKLNALKHGLLAQSVVVRGHKVKESPNEFKKLCQEFYTSLAPIGPLEEMLVDQIVQATWRLRRARTAESGEIALSVDDGHWKRTHQHPALICMEWEIFGAPAHSMGGSALGSRLMENQLKEVRASVEKEGELSEAAIQSVVVQGKPYGLTKDLEKCVHSCSRIPTDWSLRSCAQIRKSRLWHILIKS
jgi:hypothetical protein